MPQSVIGNLRAILGAAQCRVYAIDRDPGVAKFARVLVLHLDREEQLSVPFLLEMTPQEGWSLVESATSATIRT